MPGTQSPRQLRQDVILSDIQERLETLNSRLGKLIQQAYAGGENTDPEGRLLAAQTAIREAKRAVYAAQYPQGAGYMNCTIQDPCGMCPECTP